MRKLLPGLFLAGIASACSSADEASPSASSPDAGTNQEAAAADALASDGSQHDGQPGEEDGANSDAAVPTECLTLRDVLEEMIAAQGTAAVRAALSMFIDDTFEDPEVRETLRDQISTYVDDAPGDGPFPLLPLGLLGKAQGVLEGVVVAEPPAPGPVTFDLQTMQSDCSPALPTLEPFLAQIPDLTRGGVADPSMDPCILARAQEFAEALNNLALDNGAKVVDGTTEYRNLEQVMQGLLDSGHEVRVQSKVYFANFVGLYYKGQSVAAPLWLDTGIAMKSGSLAIPMPHSGYAMHIEGPLLNANIEFFMGTDGGTRFRAWSSKPRPFWQGGRPHTRFDAATSPAQVVQFVVKAGALRKKWLAAGASLPMNGYGILGVCNDSVAALQIVAEARHPTLFPLVHDPIGTPVDEFDEALASLPRDTAGLDAQEAIGRIRTMMPYDSIEAAEVCFPAYANAIKELDGN